MKKKFWLFLFCSILILITLFSYMKHTEFKSFNFMNNKQIKKPYLTVSRTDIINKLIKDNKFNTYLEIGLNNPYRNFAYIEAENKYSVDPYDNNEDKNTEENIKKWLKYCTHRMTSDEFFAQNTKTFDLIFIDGLHTEAQVDKDIRNALKVLNNGGYIVVHDCIPLNEISQREKREIGTWNGTVWKSFVKISNLNINNIETFVINEDHGVGIIHKLGNVEYELPKPLNMSYEKFEKDKNNLYKIVKAEDFFYKKSK